MHVRLTLTLPRQTMLPYSRWLLVLRRAALAMVMSFLVCQLPAALDSNALQRQLEARFGPTQVALLNDWLQMTEAAKAVNEDAKLKRVNDFINRSIVFDNDISIWEQSDYWATPLETIGQRGGDCEDFAIIKYVSLRLAGVPVHKLRLVYVKARMKGPSGGEVQQAHMVLAYYATPTSEPLVLDNLDKSIQPASKRPDLQPVFSFNSEGIFAGVAGSIKATEGGIGRLSRWEDAWRRIRAEGYE